MAVKLRARIRRLAGRIASAFRTAAGVALWGRVVLSVSALSMIGVGCYLTFGGGIGLLAVGVLLWIDLNRRV